MSVLVVAVASPIHQIAPASEDEESRNDLQALVCSSNYRKSTLVFGTLPKSSMACFSLQGSLTLAMTKRVK